MDDQTIKGIMALDLSMEYTNAQMKGLLGVDHLDIIDEPIKQALRDAGWMAGSVFWSDGSVNIIWSHRGTNGAYDDEETVAEV